jgi:ribonuclease R
MTPSENAGRTGPLLLTLDSAHTKDVDDAFSCTRNPDGHLITVAIANAAQHVIKDSNLDVTAKARAATVYSGTFTRASMLPREISEDLGSLSEGKTRRALVFRIQLDSELNVTRFKPSVENVTVDKRLHYEDITALLANPQHPFFEPVKAATRIAQMLLAQRRKHGALAFYDLTRMLASSEEGAAIRFKDAGETIGHVLVQELMILTNRLVAEYLLEHDIPAIFRNHEAKVSSPPSGELVESLEAWMAGGVDIEVLQQKVSLIAARAEYSGAALGHYGLTLPAYVHATSPLRRYPDLIVQRQLVAHLTGKPLPYGPSEMSVLAAGLNDILRERQEDRSAGFKAVVRQRAMKALTREHFAHLAEPELIKAIELLPTSEEMPESLTVELEQRLVESSISDKLAFALVTEGLRLALPDILKSALTDWLGNAPQRAVNYLNHATQAGQVASLVFDTRSTASGFESTGSMTRLAGAGRPSQTYTREAQGTTKKAAEQQGAKNLLLAVLDIEAPGPNDPASSVAEQTPVSRDTGQTLPTLNPKNRLLELCQSKKWPMPGFSSRQTGPSHAPQFDCRAMLSISGCILEGKAAGATTKKAAELAAAEDLLSSINEAALLSAKPARTPASGPNAKNAISLLQEWAQGRKIPMPVYEFSSPEKPDDGFACSVTVAGRDESFSATGATKQEAKLVAAQLALTTVTGLLTETRNKS